MKKQIVTIIAAAALAIGLTACGEGQVVSSVQASPEITITTQKKVIAKETVAKAEEPETPAEPEIKETEESGTLYTLERTAMYRSADDNQEAYSYLPLGCKLDVLAKTENGYTKVQYGLKKGYLKNELLTVEVPVVEEEPEAAEEEQTVETTNAAAQSNTKTAGTTATAAPATNVSSAAQAAPAVATPAAPSAADIAAQQAAEAIVAQQAAEAEAAAAAQATAAAAATPAPAPAPTPETVYVNGHDLSQGSADVWGTEPPSLTWTQEQIDASNADPTRVSAGNHTVEEMNRGNVSDIQL